jgi:pilus assembly protein CpaB
MSRRRRAGLLLGLALVLGGLAASDVSRREAALRAQLAPLVDVVVARRELVAGERLRPGDLEIRRVPARFAPPGGPVVPEALVGERLAVPVPAGGDVSSLDLEQPEPAAGAPVRAGERAAEVVAVAAPGAVAPGVRVDVLVTRERGAGAGSTTLALEDVEVLAARPVRATSAARAGPHVAATLRVTPRQAVYLAAAEAFAREVRLLARAPGDRRRTGPLVQR